MRKTIYQCDTCKKILSDEEKISFAHISVDFSKNSGWVSKKLAYTPVWRHDITTEGIFQFCDEKCLAKHFANLRKRITKGCEANAEPDVHFFLKPKVEYLKGRKYHVYRSRKPVPKKIPTKI